MKKIMRNLLDRFNNLKGEDKKKIASLVGVGVFVLIVLVYYFFGIVNNPVTNTKQNNEKEKQKEKEIKRKVETEFKTEEELSLRALINKKIEEAKEEFKKEYSAQQKKESKPSLPPTPPIVNEKEENKQEMPVKQAFPPPPKITETKEEQKDVQLPPINGPLPQRPAGENKIVIQNVAGIGYEKVEENASQEDNETQTKKTEEEKIKINYLPANSVFRGTLVTGVYAPTLTKGKSNPYPVLIRLEGKAFLPNEVRKRVSGCYLSGEAYGELSEERVQIRLTYLSCVNNKKELVFEEKVKGYVQGNDGIVGLAGEVISKQGRVLAAAFVADFLAGIGQAFKLASQTTVVTPLGGTQTVFDQDMGTIIKAGAGSGVGKAFEELAKYYKQLLQETFPIIKINGGRPVTVILTEGVELKPQKFKWIGVSQKKDYDKKDYSKRDLIEAMENEE